MSVIDHDHCEDLRQALEAMLPGKLGSKEEYLTNALYHACVNIARRALDATSNPAREPSECRAKSWQLDGFAICRGPAGHDGGHVWEVQ